MKLITKEQAKEIVDNGEVLDDILLREMVYERSDPMVGYWYAKNTADFTKDKADMMKRNDSPLEDICEEIQYQIRFLTAIHKSVRKANYRDDHKQHILESFQEAITDLVKLKSKYQPVQKVAETDAEREKAKKDQLLLGNHSKGSMINYTSQIAKSIPKKNDPNGPCPCGSGKKFSKCCGAVQTANSGKSGGKGSGNSYDDLYKALLAPIDLNKLKDAYTDKLKDAFKDIGKYIDPKDTK